MHELAITQGILAVAVEAAQQNGGKKIRTINLVVGELSSIVDDSVQFYFDLLSRDTLAEEATLGFRREPAIVRCLNCSHQFQASVPLMPLCLACGSTRLQVCGGREFYVESIEVDDDHSGS
jgi:hydrogenase nickel incorporation protein HypA/HybF